MHIWRRRKRCPVFSGKPQQPAGVNLLQKALDPGGAYLPHVETHTRQQFVDTNISGTLNLLDAIRARLERAATVRADGARAARSN